MTLIHLNTWPVRVLAVVAALTALRLVVLGSKNLWNRVAQSRCDPVRT